MKQKYYTIGIILCLATSLLGIHTKFVIFHILGTLSVLALFYVATQSIQKYFTKQHAPTLSTIAILSGTILLEVGIYFLYGIGVYTVSLIPILYAIIGLKNTTFTFPHINIQWPKKWFLFSLISIFEIVLFCTSFFFQTTGVLLSPWNILPTWFFVLFFFTTLLLLIYTYKDKHSFTKVLVVVHILNTLSLLTSLYTLGYGFDPFLHRAAQDHIMQFGFIEPKTPFYIGQYVSVISLSFISHIPLFFIDVWFVPVLSSILITIGGYTFFSHYKQTDNQPLFYTLLLLLFPLSYLTMTTPYNVSVLLFLFGIIITQTLLSSRNGIIVLVLLALTTSTVHPLAGICLFIFLLFSWLHQTKTSWSKYIISFIASSFIVPVLFFLYGRVSPEVVITIHPLFETIHKYISLIRPHYTPLNPDLSLILSIIYTFKNFLPILFFILLLVAYKKLKSEIIPFVITSLVILINIFGILLFVSFPNLGDKEQIQYAERLFYLFFLPLVPLAIYGLSRLHTKYFNGKYGGYLFLIICSVFLAFSLYITYPQNNLQTKAKGYNVTASDITAIQYIQKDGTGTRFVVLSNIMTAAAAVDQFGFNTYYPYNNSLIYYYSIPTGGYLADQYNLLLYTRQKREYITDIMDTLDVDRVYVLISDYWHNKKEVLPGLRSIADSEHVIENGAITIFRFDR